MISGEFTFGATKSHDQRAIALVQLPEAGAASSVSDDGQLSQDECLCNIKYAFTVYIDCPDMKITTMLVLICY